MKARKKTEKLNPRAPFYDYIFENWSGGKRSARWFADYLCDSGMGIKQMMQEFSEEYLLANPVQHLEIWKYLLSIKEAAENEERKLQRTNEWRKLESGENIPSDVQESILHIEELPEKLQLAILSEINDFGLIMRPFIYDNLHYIFPNLEELPAILLISALKTKDTPLIVQALSQMDPQYTSQYQILTIRVNTYASIGQAELLEIAAKDAWINLREGRSPADWYLAYRTAVSLCELKHYDTARKLFFSCIKHPGRMKIERHCEWIYSAFLSALQLPESCIQTEGDYLAEKFCWYLQYLRKKKVNLDQAGHMDYICQFITEFSGKRKNSMLEEAFFYLLNTLKSMQLSEK